MEKHLDNLLQRYPSLTVCKADIYMAYDMLRNLFVKEGVLYVCGNGGSAADAEHIVGELMKGFILPRPISDALKSDFIDEYGEDGKFLATSLQAGLRAVALTGHPALSTAFANDVQGKLVFAQQLHVMGKRGDLLLGISTSGNSANVIHAFQVAKLMGLQTIALTGAQGGRSKELASCTIAVPETETYKIQELHLPIYHTICMMLEEFFYGQEEE